MRLDSKGVRRNSARMMQRLEADDVVEIRQRSEGREPLIGWISADSATRLLVETIVDGAFHGWRILPTHDITHAERTGWTRLATRMLRGDRRSAPTEVSAVLASPWRVLLTALETHFGVIAITRLPDVNELFVGRVLHWIDDGLWILTIDADGTIDPEPFEVRFDAITCVEFGSPYTAMYTGAVDWAVAHGSVLVIVLWTVVDRGAVAVDDRIFLVEVVGADPHERIAHREHARHGVVLGVGCDLRQRHMQGLAARLALVGGPGPCQRDKGRALGLEGHFDAEQGLERVDPRLESVDIGLRSRVLCGAGIGQIGDLEAACVIAVGEDGFESLLSGRALLALETLGAVSAGGALLTLKALGAVSASGALLALDALRAVGAVSASGTLLALETLGAVSTVSAGGALLALKALGAVSAGGALGAVSASGALLALKALGAVSAGGALGAVSASGALLALDALRAVGAVSASGTLLALDAVSAVSAGGTHRTLCATSGEVL